MCGHEPPRVGSSAGKSRRHPWSGTTQQKGLYARHPSRTYDSGHMAATLRSVVPGQLSPLRRCTSWCCCCGHTLRVSWWARSTGTVLCWAAIPVACSMTTCDSRSLRLLAQILLLVQASATKMVARPASTTYRIVSPLRPRPGIPEQLAHRGVSGRILSTVHRPGCGPATQRRRPCLRKVHAACARIRRPDRLPVSYRVLKPAVNASRRLRP